METNFEFTKTAAAVNFSYSRKEAIDEREIHPYHEILYYIDGGATFICDKFTQKLRPHSLLLIPKDTYHFFRLEAPERFERLKISFQELQGFEELIDQEFSTARLFDELDEKTLSSLRDICREVKRDGGGVKGAAGIFGALLILLSDIDIFNGRRYAEKRDSIISEALIYLKGHPSADLSAEAVARAIGVSVSTLSHSFKREMGISLHKYVTQTRLALAEKLLSLGKNPTKIYAECGFGDYSSFYKAYVRYFGRSPSSRES